MDSDSWFPCYPSELISNTGRLLPHDFGAYMRLLCDYYLNGPLPDDDEALMEISHVGKSDWSRTKGKLMVAPFFQLNGDGKWHQKRADEVIAEREQRAKAIQDGSKKGVKKRRQMGQLPPEPPDEPKDEPGDIPMDEPKDKPLENITKTTTKTKTKGTGTTTSIASSFKSDSIQREDWNGLELSTKMVRILGSQEIANRPDWLRRAERNPTRIEEIMNAMHSDIAIGAVIKNRGAYAETLWKKLQ